jgi:CheY-like chemotaxis protein
MRFLGGILREAHGFTSATKPKFTCIGIARGAPFSAPCGIACSATTLLEAAAWRVRANWNTGMPKVPLVSIVEDDRFFRESLRLLMTSLDYNVEAFSSGPDFLASPRLIETRCLIADVHMPAMTGVELYRHLIEAGYAIPTILVTAYPDDEVRASVLREGVVCYLRKPLDDKQLIRCLRAALNSGEPRDEKS